MEFPTEIPFDLSQLQSLTLEQGVVMVALFLVGAFLGSWNKGRKVKKQRDEF